MQIQTITIVDIVCAPDSSCNLQPPEVTQSRRFELYDRLERHNVSFDSETKDTTTAHLSATPFSSSSLYFSTALSVYCIIYHNPLFSSLMSALVW